MLVIDTSSLIQIKQVVPAEHRKMVFAHLSELVERDVLVYPAEVVAELGRAAKPGDMPHQWATQNEEHATRHGSMLTEVSQILRHAHVRRVLDPDKATGVDEADPYVLALALHLKQGSDVMVLTEERRDSPKKLSMASACGLLRFFCLSIEPFMAQQKIWPSARS